MKSWICTAVGAVGSWIAYMLGGWDTALVTLVIVMAVDYITGVIVALLKRSKKTESGGLSSAVGFIGLAKKIMILLFVLIGTRLDMVIGTDYIRNAIIIGYMANELISITENAGLLGLPLPEVVTGTIDILKSRSKSSRNAESGNDDNAESD